MLIHRHNDRNNSHRRPRALRGKGLVSALLACALISSAAEAKAQSRPDPDPWWGTDKALHLSMSAAITGGSYGVSTLIADDIAGRAALAASVGVAAGLFKEVADSLGLGTPSWKDFLWDLAGTGIALSVSVSIDFGVRAAQGK